MTKVNPSPESALSPSSASLLLLSSPTSAGWEGSGTEGESDLVAASWFCSRGGSLPGGGGGPAAFSSEDESESSSESTSSTPSATAADSG